VTTIDREELVATATREIRGSTTGHLSLRTRDHMWTAMGPYGESAKGEVTIGLRRRVSLMHACASRALPIWQSDSQRAGKALVNEQDEPTKVLELVASYLNGSSTLAEVRTTANRFGTLLQYMYEIETEYPGAVLVLHAMASLLSCAVRDVGQYEEGDSDELLDGWDTDMYACWAEVGAPLWKDGSAAHVAMRAEFWLWYAERAYSNAWDRPIGMPGDLQK